MNIASLRFIQQMKMNPFRPEDHSTKAWQLNWKTLVFLSMLFVLCIWPWSPIWKYVASRDLPEAKDLKDLVKNVNSLNSERIYCTFKDLCYIFTEDAKRDPRSGMGSNHKYTILSNLNRTLNLVAAINLILTWSFKSFNDIKFRFLFLIFKRWGRGHP